MELKKQNNNVIWALVTLVVVIAAVAVAGMLLLGHDDESIQGQMEASEYRVSSKVPGRILHFYVKEGDHVRAGDTLVVLEAPDVAAKLSQAEEQLQGAYEMWQKAKAGLDIAEKSYRRVDRLFEEGVMSAQKRDEAYANYQAMKATERAARAQYEMARNGAQREDKEAAAAQVARAKGAIAEVESYMKETILLAQMDGEVSEIFPETGELVGTGAPIMNITMLDDRWATFNVREDLLSGLAVGKEFTAYVPAFGKDIKLKVTYMKDRGTYAAWKATKTTGQFDLKTFEVRAVPVGVKEVLRPGMSVIIKR